MHANGCPDRQRIAAFVEGTLPEPEAVAILQHVEACAACRAAVEQSERHSDWLVEQLRARPPIDPYAQEPECLDALRHASRLVGERTAASAEATKTETRDLGQLGDYKLLEELGHGGMGTVYRAMHVRLGRQVALKVLASGRMSDPRAVARFEREMKAVGRLDHPNIVRATDAGEAGGVEYLVMEYLDGPNLSTLVDRGGPLPVPDACELVRQAALGLQCAHEHGLVHRDVKPSNLVLTRDGVVKLLDLGLARFRADQPAHDEMTGSGQPMGTADYMAPEQVSDTHSVDIRADIYSLGCTLYKLLAGQPPFGSADFPSTFDKMMAHRQQPVPPIGLLRRDLPPELLAALDRMLMKDPADRFATPGEVAAAMEPLAAGCDLAALLARQQQGPPTPAGAGSAASGTAGRRTAGVSSTRASEPSQPAPCAPRASWSTVAMFATVATTAIVLAAGVGLGVWITLQLQQDQHARPYSVAQAPTTGPFQPTPIQPSASNREPSATSHPATSPPVAPSTSQPPGPGPAPVEPAPAASVPGAQGTQLLPIPQSPKLPEPPEPEPAPPPGGQAPETPEPTPAAPTPPEPAPSPGPEPPPEAAPATPPAPAPTPPPEQPGPSETAAVVPSPPPAPGTTPPAVPPAPVAPPPPVTPEPPPPVAPPKPWADRIEREPPALAKGSALGKEALVAKPAAIEGVLTWTVETRGHRGAVYKAAYSPDGAQLATVGAEGVLRLWNPQNGELICILAGHDGPVYSLAWSPDGTALASAGQDRTVRLWDARSGLLLRTLRGHLGAVYAVAWSPDGQLLASASADSLVRLWEPASGKPYRDLRGHRSAAHAVAWSADGKLLASAGQDQAILVWSLASADPRALATAGLEGTVADIAWSADAKTLAAAMATPQMSGGVQFFDVATGKPSRALPGERHGNSRLAWSADDRLLAAAGATLDNSVRAYAVDAGESIYTCPKPSGVHAEYALGFSPDGRFLFAGGSRGRVQFWDAVSGAPAWELPACAASATWVELSPDEATLACGYEDGTVRLWQTESGSLVRVLGPLSDAIDTLKWSPDGKRLAVLAFGAGTVEVWDAAKGEKITQSPPVKDAIDSLTWTPDGRSLILGGKQAQQWDTGGDSLSRSVPGQGNAVAWSPDGSTVAVGSGGDVRLSAAGSSKITRVLYGPKTRLRSLVWSPDGKMLAAGADDAKVYVWDSTSGRSLVALSDAQEAVTSLAWLDGGKTLAGGSDGEVFVWAIPSGKLARRLSVDGGAFAPKRGLIVSRGPSSVRMVRLEDGKPLRTAVALADQAFFSITPDGHWTGSPGVETELLYVVQTDRSQETLSAEEFATRFRWQN